MLPALQNTFVAELQRQAERTHSAIQELIAVKGLAGHPVTLHRWGSMSDYEVPSSSAFHDPSTDLLSTYSPPFFLHFFDFCEKSVKVVSPRADLLVL
jgi:hypothetical protein